MHALTLASALSEVALLIGLSLLATMAVRLGEQRKGPGRSA